MVKIDRYIRNTVLQAMLLVLLVLLSLDIIFTLFDELSQTSDNYRTMDALRYILFTFPRHVYELLPMTALIGALTGLGVLASSNELVVMQAAGIKVSRIVWSVMKPTAIVMLLGLLLGEFVAPQMDVSAEVGKAIVNGEEVVLSSYGHWQRDGNQYMHFNAIEPGGILHGVNIYSFDDQRQLVANTFAQRAVYRQEGEENYWLLEDVDETDFQRNGDVVSSVNNSYESRRWNVDLSPDLLRILIVDPDRMAISDLFQYARRFERQGQDASQYFLSFWKKLLQPFTTAVLVLVAVSFIFGPLRESTTGSRVFAAICFGMLFIILQRLLNTVSLVYQFDPLSAVVLPLLLSAGVGLYLLKRAA